MMTIYLNGNGSTILDDSIKYNIQPEVFENKIIADAMQDIEHIYKIEGLAFYSSDYGVKSPESLSNGMKTLILCTYQGKNGYDELLSNACLGANCAEYLRRLSFEFDFTIAWDYFLDLDADKEIEARDYRTGTVFTKCSEVLDFYCGKAGTPGCF